MRAIDLYEGPEGWVASSPGSGRCLTFRRESGEAVLGKWRGSDGLELRRPGLALAGVLQCYSYRALLLLEPPAGPVPDVYPIDDVHLLFQAGAPSYLQRLVVYTVSDALRYAYVDTTARFSPENPFCFNRHLADCIPAPERPDLGAPGDLLCHIFSGYYKVVSLGSRGRLQYRLQRAPDNCGCRYFSRGIDALGHTANTAVATLSLNGAEIYRLYRGGIPVLFNQGPQPRYTPTFRFLVPAGAVAEAASGRRPPAGPFGSGYAVVTSAGGNWPPGGAPVAAVCAANTPEDLLARHLYLLLWTEFLPDDEAFLSESERQPGARGPAGQFADEAVPENTVTFVNLMKASGAEGMLSDVFEGVVRRAGAGLRTEYCHVLFNSLTNAQLEAEAERLLQRTLRPAGAGLSSPSLSRDPHSGEAWAPRPGAGSAQGSAEQKSASPAPPGLAQASFLKVNCLDCVDRTTAMQTMILRHAARVLLDQRFGPAWSEPVASLPARRAAERPPSPAPPAPGFPRGLPHGVPPGLPRALPAGVPPGKIVTASRGVPAHPVAQLAAWLAPGARGRPREGGAEAREGEAAGPAGIPGDPQAGSPPGASSEVVSGTPSAASAAPGSAAATLSREDVLQLLSQASYASGRVCSLHYMNAPPQRRLQNVLPPSRAARAADRFFDLVNGLFRYLVNRHAQRANLIYQRIWAGDPQPEYNVSVLSSLNVSLLIALFLAASVTLFVVASATPGEPGGCVPPGWGRAGSFWVWAFPRSAGLGGGLGGALAGAPADAPAGASLETPAGVPTGASTGASADAPPRGPAALRALLDAAALPARLLYACLVSVDCASLSSSRMFLPALICFAAFSALLLLVVFSSGDGPREAAWARETARLVALYYGKGR